MNKLFTAAETAALDLATAAPASTITSTAEAKGCFFRRCFKNLHLRRASRLYADPAASVDSQLFDEPGWKSDRYQTALYDLAASNPHVIAVSLFSRKNR